MSKQAPSYNESNIKILEGLDPIKLRPGQFTRTDCPDHIIQEVIDNAIDEALAGYASALTVSFLPEGDVEISDNGRGIPVGVHAEKGIPAVQAIFTVLYSGGKFEKQDGNSAYSLSGGLHGVGVSVTNALSESLICDVQREGYLWRIGFSNGDVVAPLKKIEKSAKTGTTVRVKPNPKYFDSPHVNVAYLQKLLQTKAVLLPGLTVTVRDLRDQSNPVESVYAYAGGIKDYLNELLIQDPLIPIIVGSGAYEGDDGLFTPQEIVEWAFTWEPTSDSESKSFVNLIPTPDHGTHVNGLKAAIMESVKEYIDHHALLPKGLKISAEDCFKGVSFVLSIKMIDSSFDNQTKDKLNSRDAVKLVSSIVRPAFEAWLSLNPAFARQIADFTIKAASDRAKKSVKVEKRKSSSIVMLPGKLADCESKDADETELFLVEGDSAGGSAKQARDREFQAIMPMKGKSLNVWEKTAQQAMDSEEIRNIATAIGVVPHLTTSDVDWSKLRYNKICILADADVDGFHIQSLILTLFYKHFPQLITRGHVYVACPPLYRIDTESAGRAKPAKKLYAMDTAELKKIESRLTKEGYKSIRVGRFKGLGEMNPEELKETTIDPNSRRLMKVVLEDGTAPAADEMFNNLMSKKPIYTAWRKSWMEEKGDTVDNE